MLFFVKFELHYANNDDYENRVNGQQIIYFTPLTPTPPLPLHGVTLIDVSLNLVFGANSDTVVSETHDL